MSYCDRCLDRPATPTRGLHRCEQCRLLCAFCDKPKVPNSPYCTEHRSSVGKSRPIKMKKCVDCGTEFRTKSASNYCNQCHYKRMKHPCADCGVLVAKVALRCMKCWGVAHAGDKA